MCAASIGVIAATARKPNPWGAGAERAPGNPTVAVSATLAQQRWMTQCEEAGVEPW
jgi:hypothetical protein